MRIYREHVVKLVVLFCAMALIATLISFIDTQTGNTWSTATTRTIDDGSSPRMTINFDPRAERVEIVLDHTTDHAFEVWLVDSARLNWSFPFGTPRPDEWLGHGIAGEGTIRWSVSTEDIEDELILIRETEDWGQLKGLPDNVTEARYDWTISIRSVVNPIDSGFTMAMVVLVVISVILLQWEWYLPNEQVPDFKDLYPDFPETMRTRERDDG